MANEGHSYRGARSYLSGSFKNPRVNNKAVIVEEQYCKGLLIVIVPFSSFDFVFLRLSQ